MNNDEVIEKQITDVQEKREILEVILFVVQWILDNEQ